jgi:small subunit ribosomal protein S4e
MVKIKRLLAPKFWHVEKKASKWVVRPSPGPHKKFESLPLQIVLRELLKLAETAKEAKTPIKRGDVLVDGKIQKDHRYPAGLMDTISIPKIKKYFRVTLDVNGLKLLEITEKEASVKLCRINGKTIVKKGKTQLNLHDGRNILVDKNIYNTGDSIVIELPSQKIVDHVKMEEGNIGLLTSGKNSGKLATIKKIIVVRGREPNKTICEIEGKAVEAMKDHVFVVGEKKPVVALGE